MTNQTAEGPIRDDDPNSYTPPEPGDEGYEEYMEELQQQRTRREQETFARVTRSYESRTPLLRDRAKAQPERIALTEEDMDRLYPEDVGKTPEQLRAKYLRTMHPAEVADSARSGIRSKVNKNLNISNAQFDRALAPSISRDDANGFYIGTYDQFRAKYFDDYDNRDTASDSEIIQQLIANQPHRIPCILDPDGVPAIPTYGPLMLPESIDPISAASEYPAEARPAQWAPEATLEQITEGVARDILDSAALYAARIKVATGHRPDTEAIDQLKKLTTVVKNTQKIIRGARKTKTKNLGGRPRKATLPDTIQVTTLKLEIAEKNKKHGNRKIASLTQAASVSELVKTSALSLNRNPI